jgi:selenide,water dikinase
MDKFRNFPEMDSSQPSTKNRVSSKNPVSNPMRCAGCGAKVGSTILERVLNRISQDTQKPGHETQKPGFLEKPGFSNENILIGLNDPDDCAVVKVASDKLMVHTIDYFPALINDPFIFGQISANHSLSDIFAMGATPQTALAIATIPYATEAKTEETLYQLLAGATKILEQSQTALVGGHTTEGKDLAFGLACNGFVSADKLLRKSGMQPGQVLILTKALGTGTLFAADMQKQAKGRWIENAIDSMLLSNQKAAECLIQSGATACTDITGFGLLGHLMEMIKASEKEIAINVEINLEAIAILDGAKETVAQGILSSLHPENFRVACQIHNLAEVQHHANFPLLFDPQTSGGLLASIPQNQAHDCLAALKDLGYPHSHIIGEIKPGRGGVLPINIL